MAGKRRLLWQLYPTYLLITIISLVAVTWYASRSLKHFFLDQIASDLRARAQLLESQVLERLDPLDREGIDRLCKFAGKRSATRITLILPSGKVAGDSEENPAKMDTHVDRPEFVESLKGEFGMSLRFSRTLGQNMMYAGIPLRGEDGRLLAVLRTSIPVDAVDHTLREIRLRIVLGGVIIAILAALLSLWVSRRLTRPIEQMRQWARDAARGEFRPRISDTRFEEIGALSDSMNDMAHELHDRIDMVLRQRNEIGAVLSSMVEGVIAVDRDERVISMNGAAGRLFGCDPTGVKGRSIQEVVRNTELHGFVKKALASHAPVEREIVLSSESEKYLQGHGTQLRSAEGGQIGALIVLNDMTRIRRLENIRRDFVANVSHEIKTPITAIKGFVETLRDGALSSPEDAERFLEIIGKHADRLEAIIEDLLSLSRIEQEVEKHKISLSEGRVGEVLETAVQVCEVRAEARTIALELSCPADLCAPLNPTLLEQAVVNLIDNAVKYSGAGRAVRIEATEGESEIRIDVRDEGCGIEREHLPRLFERFYRVDKARSRKLGGTGLGLAIVKHIVQAHGGRVTVESAPGRGSTFTIHLPKA